MPILVLNTEEDAKRIYGNALDELAVDAVFFTETAISPARLLDDLRPELLLLSLEWLPQWRILSAQARKRGIPVVYVMDGIIEWSYLWNNLSYVQPHGTVLQPLLADHLCVIGRHPARILSAMGLGEKLHLIGLPRLDGLKPRRILPAERRPTILVTTARTYAHNPRDKVLVKQALRDLKQFFEQTSTVTPLWRIDTTLAAELGISLSDTSCPIEEVLSRVDGLVSFPSTALLEGMRFGLPVAQIDYRAVPTLFQTAWVISSNHQIQPVIQELLYPPPEKLAFQQFCLEDELEEGNATQRLVALLDTLLKDPALVDKENKHKQPLAPFGCLDYRQIHSQLSCFALSDLSLIQYELDACYKHLDMIENELSSLLQDIDRPLPFGIKRIFPGTSSRIVSAKERIARLFRRTF